MQPDLLFEISSEVCNKVGGIYRVIQSKAPYMNSQENVDYYLIGPYLEDTDYTNIFKLKPESEIDESVLASICELRRQNIKVHVGNWMIKGNPTVLLFEVEDRPENDQQIKKRYSVSSGIKFQPNFFLDLIIRFGYYLEKFFSALPVQDRRILAHFHEYLTAVALPEIKKMGVKTIFTTHSTVLGRELSKSGFSRTTFTDANEVERRKQSLLPFHKTAAELEERSVKTCDVFTIVSHSYSDECFAVFGRRPDVITPNGLNTDEVINAGPDRGVRNVIDKLVHNHFQPKASGRTVYLFTSGRYEYRNKGYEIIISALGKLNKWLKATGSDINVVMFIITDRPFINPSMVFKNRLRQVAGKLPFLKKLFEKEVRSYFLQPTSIRIASCRLVEDLRKNKLYNDETDPVKVIYHPAFLSGADAALKLEYFQFIRSCDLGVFPSLYEPWGYTPAECLLCGTPAVATDVSGFAQYVESIDALKGMNMLFNLTISSDQNKMSDELTTILKDWLAMKKPNYESYLAVLKSYLDWSNLAQHYLAAYRKEESVVIADT